MKKYKFGILGVGKMGSSILEGILKANLYKKEEILLYDISEDIIQKYKKRGLNFAKDEVELTSNVETLLLSIKPQMFNTLKSKLFSFENILIISIVAGKSISDIKAIFGNQRIIRVMPNTPSLIGFGATAVGKTSNSCENDIKLVNNIFNQIGVSLTIPDELMNEIIPVNGSMPAYLYYFAKCFIEKAVSNGINYESAKYLAVHAIIGSAKMIEESGKDIDTLINDVCSPKGATLEGLKVLEERKLKEIIDECSDATIKRAYELSKI